METADSCETLVNSPDGTTPDSRISDIFRKLATRYGTDGPRIEFRWGLRFSTPVQTGPGAHPASYAVSTGPFPGVKRPRSGVDHSPPSSAEVKERV
jgi:hypothetical protein